MKEYMLLFDLDGTLWNSAKEVADSWNIVLQKRNPSIPLLTASDLNSLMGKTMDEIAELILPEMPLEGRRELFRECEEFEVAYIAEHGAKLYPKVKETLKTLSDAGYRMAIVSNCQKGYINAFFTSMHMKTYFCDMEEWGNTKKSKAENIRLVMERNQFEKAVYIGDTIKDQEAAQIAGIPFIHTAYGFGEVENADGTIQKFEDLPALLRKY
ncbi:MAG: HAD family hydrolase [Parasporobacterium sp.]|nr:HAD family hydrolase [Parasporobacterium sp.]